MSNYKENWREYEPPMIPIYFMGYEELKDMLEKNPSVLNNEAMELMLGFFEEYQLFEKAALVKKAQDKLELFVEPEKDNKQDDNPKTDFTQDNPFV